MGKGPAILKRGDPDCIHYEIIASDLIGTCRKCGRRRSYMQTSRQNPWILDKSIKGGAAERKPVGSVNPESNAWNGMAGQKRPKAKRIFRKGVDF